MTTIVILLLMTLVFAAVLYCIQRWWYRTLRNKPYLTLEEGEALDLGTVPFAWLLRGYVVAGMRTGLSGCRHATSPCPGP